MTSSPRRLVLFVAAGFFVLWALANAPALRQAWWFFDDYSVGDVLSAGNVEHHLEQGRPGQLVWMFTFLMDAGGQRTAANVALRLVQGLLHCLAGAFAAVLLWCVTRQRLTLLAPLPFVLWPYAGEVVLWRAAGEYPLAALLAVAGAWKARTSERLPGGLAAAALLAAGVLTHQLAAGAGLVVWCLVVGVMAVVDQPLPWRRLGREALLLANGYVMGGAASVAIAWLLSGGDPGRLRPVSSAADKLHFLAEANATFLTSPIFYPRWLAACAVGAAALPFVVLAVAAALGRLRRGRAVLAAAALATAFVTPYAAQLAVADNQLSWRVLYLAPFVFAGGWAILDGLAAKAAARAAAAAVYAAVVAAFVPLSWNASGVYVRLYEADRAALRDIEAKAAALGVRRVFVVTSEAAPRDMNPHGLDYRWGGLKMSALLVEWSAPYFVRWFSSLEPVDDDAVGGACTASCSIPNEAPGFHVHRIARGPTLCVCPP